MSLLEDIINTFRKPIVTALVAANIYGGIGMLPAKADEPIIQKSESSEYVPPANDAELDAILLASHTPLWTMTNPIADTKIVGIAGNGKDEFAIAFDHGAVLRYSESTATAPGGPIATFGGGDSTTNSVFYNIDGPAVMTEQIASCAVAIGALTDHSVLL